MPDSDHNLNENMHQNYQGFKRCLKGLDLIFKHKILIPACHPSITSSTKYRYYQWVFMHSFIYSHSTLKHSRCLS